MPSFFYNWIVFFFIMILCFPINYTVYRLVHRHGHHYVVRPRTRMGISHRTATHAHFLVINKSAVIQSPLRPWCTKILKDTTIDQSKKCFGRMRSLRDLKYMYIETATSKQKSNTVHSQNRLRIISEQIDRNISTQIPWSYFFLKCHVYFIDGVVTHYVYLVWKARRWRTVVRNIAKLSSNWLYQDLGLVNVKRILEIRIFFVRKTVIIIKISAHSNVLQRYTCKCFAIERRLQIKSNCLVSWEFWYLLI